jgi:hypothetical protein
MSDVREIPGYYYGTTLISRPSRDIYCTYKMADKEKKKYFKIQPRSTAPASAAYSSHNVKRRRLKDEQEAAAAKIVKRQQNQIRRCRLLEAPLAGGILAREQSYGSQNVDSASIYAGGLVNRGSMGWRHNSDRVCSHLWAIGPRLNISPGMIDVYSGSVALSSIFFNSLKYSDK